MTELWAKLPQREQEPAAQRDSQLHMGLPAVLPSLPSRPGCDFLPAVIPLLSMAGARQRERDEEGTYCPTAHDSALSR